MGTFSIAITIRHWFEVVEILFVKRTQCVSVTRGYDNLNRGTNCHKEKQSCGHWHWNASSDLSRAEIKCFLAHHVHTLRMSQWLTIKLLFGTLVSSRSLRAFGSKSMCC